MRFMAREIHILRRLDHPNVIKLEGIVTSRMSHSLYLVFQYMEHDLAGLAAVPGIKFTESQVYDASFVLTRYGINNAFFLLAGQLCRKLCNIKWGHHFCFVCFLSLLLSCT